MGTEHDLRSRAAIAFLPVIFSSLLFIYPVRPLPQLRRVADPVFVRHIIVTAPTTSAFEAVPSKQEQTKAIFANDSVNPGALISGKRKQDLVKSRLLDRFTRPAETTAACLLSQNKDRLAYLFESPPCLVSYPHSLVS